MTSLLKKLERRQRQHTRMLARVERTAARLDRRKLKLAALESRMADLERRIAGGGRGTSGVAAPGARRAQLIFNPASGRDAGHNAARLKEIVACLATHGIEASIGLKTSGRAARELARDAVRAGTPLVIVAAGDGTIGDVASELLGKPTVLGIVPIGTMNNVARSLGIPLEIDAACGLIATGTTRHIDAGRVRTNQSDHDECFLECAGLGLSAIGALAGQSYMKGRWRLLPKAVRRFFEARLGHMRIELDGVAVEASTRIVTVSNAPLMGQNMLAAPGALMDDGLLDVSIYDQMGDAALVRHFRTASKHETDDLAIRRARHIVITADEPVMTNSDMDLAPARHVVEIECLPAALTMIVGNGIALSVPVASAPPAPVFAEEPTATASAPANGTTTPATAPEAAPIPARV